MPAVSPPSSHDQRWLQRLHARASAIWTRWAPVLEELRADLAHLGTEAGLALAGRTARWRGRLSRGAAASGVGLGRAAHGAGTVTGAGLRTARRVLTSALVPLVLVAIAAVALPRVGLPYELGEPDPISLAPLAARSTVLAADGSPLAVLHAGENRVPLPLEEMPAHLVEAVIAVEDASFFTHSGVDARGITRAVLENVSAGGIVAGGSTLTQQLAKLEADRRDDEATRTLGDKVHETGLAFRIERSLEKREILEHYLNAVFLGHGTYGMAAAAEYYFGRPVGEIDVPQAALLAGLIAGPRRFDPFENPDAARERRGFVLGRMAELGHLGPAEVAAFEAAPLPTEAHPPDVDLGHGEQYFLQDVKRRLLDDPRLGATREERVRRVFGGGLVIETTLDPALQRAAAAAVAGELPESEFTAALVAQDPATGEVKALVGGPGFEEAKFNLATQGARQPGSSFKVVTLAAALEAGFSPLDMVDGTSPCEFPQPHDDEPWHVENYEGSAGGIVPLHEALARSYNCAFARVVLALGPERVVDMAHRLGVERHLDAFPAITLGTEEVSPLEMAAVFATLAAEGVRRSPVLVRRVLGPDGEVLIDDATTEEHAIPIQLARLTTAVLEGVITNGTGTRAAIGRPAAGKTGTSQQWRNAWFGGYTPDLAAVVWMGSPTGDVSMRDVGGTRVTGGSYPAEIWAAFMRAALDGRPVSAFTAPDLTGLPEPMLVTEAGRVPIPPPEPPPEETPPDAEGGEAGESGNGNGGPGGGSGGGSGGGGGRRGGGGGESGD